MTELSNKNSKQVAAAAIPAGEISLTSKDLVGAPIELYKELSIEELKDVKQKASKVLRKKTKHLAKDDEPMKYAEVIEEDGAKKGKKDIHKHGHRGHRGHRARHNFGSLGGHTRDDVYCMDFPPPPPPPPGPPGPPGPHPFGHYGPPPAHHHHYHYHQSTPPPPPPPPHYPFHESMREFGKSRGFGRYHHLPHHREFGPRDDFSMFAEREGPADHPFHEFGRPHPPPPPHHYHHHRRFPKGSKFEFCDAFDDIPSRSHSHPPPPPPPPPFHAHGHPRHHAHPDPFFDFEYFDHGKRGGFHPFGGPPPPPPPPPPAGPFDPFRSLLHGRRRFDRAYDSASESDSECSSTDSLDSKTVGDEDVEKKSASTEDEDMEILFTDASKQK